MLAVKTFHTWHVMGPVAESRYLSIHKRKAGQHLERQIEILAFRSLVIKGLCQGITDNPARTESNVAFLAPPP